MTHEVLRTFKTPSQIFVAGAIVAAKDVDGAIPVEQWIEMGFLSAIDAPAPERKAEPQWFRADPAKPAVDHNAAPIDLGSEE